MGVPARFMRPRIVLVVVTFVLVAFGLLMIYSASSIKAQSSQGDAAYYLKRQLLFVLVGLAGAVLLARTDYHVWYKKALRIIWVVTLALLALTALMGIGSHGATRWISIGPINLQPSEFAKITIVLTGANLCESYFDDGAIDFRQFLINGAIGVGIPLVLVLAQPDKGSTLIAAATLLVMLYLSGVSGKTILLILGICLAAFFVYSMKDEYSRKRFLTSLDPWSDPYGDGYQLIQGFYAFGTGGLFGVGIGMSKQKYSYLPEAHNDFIFAIIGEECGLVGCLAVIAAFVIFVYAGIQICKYAPDLAGRLIACGCTSLIAIQFFVNVLGVIGITPLTGKPLPFLSYGGSSIISCLMLVGLIVSVSRSSVLPETVNERRRRQMSVAAESATDVGRVMTRSEAMATPLPQVRDTVGRQGSSRDGLRLVDDAGPTASRGTGRGRIDLGDRPADRLRPQGGPRVRGGRDDRRGSGSGRR
jgi:cell division protein FtsW